MGLKLEDIVEREQLQTRLETEREREHSEDSNGKSNLP